MAVLENGVWHVKKEASELAVEDNFTTEIVSEKKQVSFVHVACLSFCAPSFVGY